MSSYHGTTEELMSTMGRREESGHAEEWQRWDEDLVKDFGLWVGCLAKTFGLLLLGVLAALLIAWL